MIYHVVERIGHDCMAFFFDANKIDPTKPFEAAYLELLQHAAAAPDKSIQTDLPGALRERCGRYQEGARPWTRLLRKPPCKVDKSVTVWIGD